MKTRWRTIAMLIMLYFAAQGVSAQDWFPVEVAPEDWEDLDLNDVCFAGAQGWAVGEKGTIIHTYNGTRWHNQISGVGTDLYSVYFHDTQQGWAVGNSGVILYTEDGGATWELERQTNDYNLYGVYFIDDRRGWAVGARGTILYTDNSGSTWRRTQEGFTTEDLYDIYFHDITSGWVVGENGTILHWNGTRWGQRQSNTDEDLYGVHFTSWTDGWIVGDHGTILHSSDGLIWASWKARADSDDLDLRSVHFPRGENQYGWIVGEKGAVLYTRDFGTNWWRKDMQIGSNLNAVYAPNANQIWAVGNDGTIIQSINRGNSWDVFENPLYGNFWDVSISSNLYWDVEFVFDLNGWIVGDGGVILKMEDDGMSWSEYPSPTNNVLYSVHMLDKYNAWAVGDAGVIVRTKDGSRWELSESPAGRRLRGVYFTSMTNGWAVGDRGTILHWDDSRTWRTQATSITEDLYGVYFLDDNEGWAVGNYGTALHTSNGGLDWTEMETNSTDLLRAAYFTDGNNGWIVGDAGTVLYWHNGKFAEQNSHTSSDLYGVDFVDNVQGWIAGTDRVICNTTNAGAVWSMLTIPATGDLYAIGFANSRTGFAVGENGTVVRYAGVTPSTKIELVSPYGNITTLNPTFKWTTTRPDVQHTIFIDSDSDPFRDWTHAITVSGSTTSHTLVESLNPGTYYWGVETTDGSRSGILQFTAWPPTVITPIWPVSFVPTDSPIFHWDCNNKDLESITYTLYVDDDGMPYDAEGVPAGRNLNQMVADLPEGEYSWGVKASDGAQSKVVTFAIDLSEPTGTIVINGGDEFTNSLTVTLLLTATDILSTGRPGSGVTDMRLSNDGSTWSPRLPFTEGATATVTWDMSEYGGNSQDGLKMVYVQYMDALGHWIAAPASDEITLDTMPPRSGAISINNGAEVTGPDNVTLFLSASDDRSGVEDGGEMMLSNDGTTWSPPLPFEASRSWNFLVYGGNENEGVKTVYVKYRDAAGNWMAQVVTDDIILDKTGPTGTIVINDGEEFTNSLLVNLKLSASDKSGVEFMQFTNGGGNWAPWIPYDIRKEGWDLSLYGGDSEDGEKIVYVRFMDRVENVTEPAVYSRITLKSGISVSVQIVAPNVEGKVKSNDVVQVKGVSEPDLVEVTMDVLDENGQPLDIDLTDVVYETESGRIAGSFNVGELTASTIQFRSTVKDALGNEAQAVSNALTVDNDPPSDASVSIVQGTLVNSLSIGLILLATDAQEMYVGGDVLNQQIWIPYADALKVKLTEGDGSKRIRVIFRDDVKNESDEVSDQVILDTTPPTGSVLINDGDDLSKSLLVTLTLLADDDNGVNSYQLSNDGIKWSEDFAWTGIGADPVRIDKWSMGSEKYGGDESEGDRTIYVKYKDNAGNWTDPISDDIHVDSTAPTISVSLVADKQEAMEPVTITAIVRSDRELTEVSLHYRRKGTAEYTTIPMMELPGDYYTGEIPGSEVTFAGVEYYISASDDIWTTTHPAKDAPIAPNSFTVVDTTRPVIEHDPVVEAPVNSSPEITAKVTEKVGLKQVSLFHKLSTERNFTEVEMIMGDVSDIYSASIPALDHLAVVEYYIKAVDTSSNSRIYPPNGEIYPYKVAFVDIESPVIIHTKVADDQEAGKSVTIGATIIDNMAVEKAVLKYKVTGKRESIEVEMDNVGTYYSAVIPGDFIMPGSIEYSITASDGSPKSEDSVESYAFTVVDTTPPDIELTFVPSEVEAHNDISIKAEVTDNVWVESVVLYYKGVEDLSWSTMSMLGLRDEYSATIPGQERTGEVRIYVYAEDSHGVSSTEPPVDPQNAPRVIAIIDISNPEIRHSPVTGTQEAGYPVNISASVSDDVGVADVSLHYRTAGQRAFKLLSMTQSGTDSLYNVSIPESAVIPPGVEYYIKAVDDSSNVSTYPKDNPDALPLSFSVADTVPPEIIYDPSGLEAIVINEPIVVTLKAADLTGIKEVKVFFRMEDEADFISKLCEDSGDGKFSTTLPSPSSEGYIYYYIRAIDNSGNESTSPKDPAAQPYSIFVDDPFPPLPPTRLAASPAPGGKVILTWELSTSPDTYKYNIYTDNGSGSVDYSSYYDLVDSNTKSWESPPLVQGEEVYKFAVRAVDESGNEEKNTNVVSAEADAIKPAAVSGLEISSLSGGRIQLRWNLSVSRDAAAYNIYWNNMQVNIDYSSPLVRINDPGNSWTSNPLNDGVVYRFVVRCQDDAGNEEENVDFLSAKADATPPGNVIGLFSSTHKVDEWSDQPEVTVKWSPAEDTGIGLAGYSIIWDASSKTLPDAVIDITDGVTTATATLSDIQYFHIRPVDQAGNWSSWASHLGPFLIDTQPPLPPTNLVASPQAGGKIRLDWAASESVDVVNYNIYRDDGPGSEIDYSNPVGQTTATVLTWTSSALKDGRPYQFSIRSEDRAGNEEKNTQKTSSVADSQPPSIIHKPVAGLLEQEITGVSIEATVTDASELDEVKLHYRKRGEAGYTEVKMAAKGAGGFFSGQIPSSTFSSAGVDYYISASDVAGNLSEHPIMTIAVGTILQIPIDASSENEILLGDGSSFLFPAGAVPSDTHLSITVPRFIPEPQTGLGQHILTREFNLGTELNKSISLTLRYGDEEAAGEDESRFGAYLWDGQRWNFLSRANADENSVVINTIRPGIFSVTPDYDAPSVVDLRPSGYAEPNARITARVEDNGSGIDPKNIEVQVSGKIFEVPGTALKGNELSLVLSQDLEPGQYSLQLTVRDNVGNETVERTEFQVLGELTLRNVFCYPNPFQPSRGAHFAYTLTESVNSLTIRIFGMDGKMVRKIDGTTSVGANEVEWDGNDGEGEPVLSSVYICHIEAEGAQETVTETIKIAGWE